ncbi:PnuC-like nicotinamide riboside transporter [Streptomyces phage Kradal]|nr:PnuC-like nicotinamide riboside transporter [Streptomyces phage Kradal]QPL14328.1 PnuC-like nicotinamide riboside transporter [Streptomyces phage EhyElimayoE]
MQWWSWILTAVGVFGLWLAGRRNPLGWAVGLGAQGLWIAYALTSSQYGFLVSAGAYGWVYTVNLRKWRQDHRAPVLPEAPNREDQHGSA